MNISTIKSYEGSVVELLFNHLKGLEPRAKILEVERLIQSSPDALGSDDFPIRHTIVNGIYLRELYVQEEIIFTGCVHKFDHIFMATGDVSIFDEYNGLQRIIGHRTFKSIKQTKRVFYTHRDTIFMTVHKMSDPNETDFDKLKWEHMSETYEDLI